MVGATLARSAGPRGMAMGMTAYIAYFMGAILNPKLAQMPLLALAIVIGVASAALVRSFVLPDMPELSLRHAESRVERHIARMLTRLEPRVGARSGPGWADWRLRRELARLNDAVLIAATQADALTRPEADRDDAGGVSAVSAALFSIDLAAERLFRVSMMAAPPQAAVAGIRAELAALRSRLNGDGAIPSGAGAASPPPFDKVIASLASSLNDLRAAIATAVGAKSAP